MAFNQSRLSTGSVTVVKATNILITNKVVATPSSEVSHVLQTNLKQLKIRARGNSKIQYTLVSGQSGTTYATIPKGCTDWIMELNLSGKTLYLQTSIADIIEITEFY